MKIKNPLRTRVKHPIKWEIQEYVVIGECNGVRFMERYWAGCPLDLDLEWAKSRITKAASLLLF